MFSKRSVETSRLIMITTYTNMTYHEYQGMFDSTINILQPIRKVCFASLLSFLKNKIADQPVSKLLVLFLV